MAQPPICEYNSSLQTLLLVVVGVDAAEARTPVAVLASTTLRVAAAFLVHAVGLSATHAHIAGEHVQFGKLFSR